MVQHQLQDHAGGNGDQNVVPAGLDPVVATRRRAQPVRTPVIDDVLAAAVFGRETITPVPRVFRTGTVSVAALASVRMGLSLRPPPGVVAAAVLLEVLPQLIFTVVTRPVAAVLGESGLSGQQQR